ncbi:MAG: hypothetical protein LM601_01045 [Candidatus Verstraetearchaeota archaeon]|jgi:hypothetical protein|nr:hypothetical protein [Candidatus Verstraetearchaeota archaeon]
MFFKVFSSFRLPFFKKLLKKCVPQLFSDSIDFLKNKYGKIEVTSEDVYANIIVSLLIISIVVLFLSINFVKDIMISFMITLFSVICIYISIYYEIIGEYDQDNFLIHIYKFMVFRDIMLIYKSTNSIFEAVNFVASESYPIISANFEVILKNIINGLDPEDFSSEEAYLKPITLLLNEMLVNVKNADKSKGYMSTKDLLNLYEKVFSKIEAYCLFLLFIGMLLPLSLMFTIPYLSKFSPINVVIPLFILLQIVSLTVMSRIVSSNIYITLGGKSHEKL